jgi:hypothetical protein
MTFKIARQIACVNPAALTAVLLMLGIAAPVMATSGMATPLVSSALTALLIGAMCTWWWAVLLVARNGLPHPHSGRWDWLFATPPLLVLTAGLANWPTVNSPAALAIFSTIFVVLTMSAKTLEKADAPDGDPSVGRMLATVVLMYVAPVGVWILHAKIKRIADRSPLIAEA